MTDTTTRPSGLFGLPPADLVDVGPDAQQFSPLIPGSASLETAAPGSLASMTMYGAPGTRERRRDLALMLRALAPEAAFTVLAPKQMGGTRLRAELEGFGCRVEDSAKRHHRICVGVRPAELHGIEVAVDGGAPQRCPDLGLWTQPGIFSWDRLDAGTALLLDALPALAGDGADFGCGLGVLAHGVLASPRVTGLHLVDVDRRAVEAAQRNVDDSRARFHWLDLRRDRPFTGLDFVVMNPPFHNAGTEDRSLGMLFIAQAAEMLRSGGELWLVANKHMPYEQVLGQRFRRTTTHLEARGFKVLSGRK